MERYYSKIHQFRLFSGIKLEELNALLKCQEAHIKKFHRKENILMAGDEPEEVRIIVEGMVEMFQEEGFENQYHLYAYLEPGEFFGECKSKATQRSIFTYRAVTDCVILVMDWDKIMNICTTACRFHKLLIRNMLDISMEKNIMLIEKMDIISRKTIRERVMAYFYQLSVIQESGQLRIPFNRTELANYLCVNRSALTRELMKMKEEGLIEFDGKDYSMKKMIF